MTASSQRGTEGLASGVRDLVMLAFRLYLATIRRANAFV
jgi:hypothetical protein